METVDVCNVSGGKDSTAMWLDSIERGVQITPVFADTGHEHAETYRYLDYLERNVGPIRRIKADFSRQIEHKRTTVQTKWRDEGISESIIDRALKALLPTGIPFLDLCLWKGRFPSTKARFCTIELKVRPTFDQVYAPLIEGGYNVVSWQGVRADESLARANLPEREIDPDGYEIYRPILKWTVEDVFAKHRQHGIEPNPLYMQGMGRVGCMPCINCGKQELFEISRRFPEEIARVAEWEEIVSEASKRGGSTLFPTANGRGDGIYEVVEWSKTAYGGKNYDLLKYMELESEISCASQYGLCE